MLSTVSPVMVGAEAASPQPTIPLSASIRTSTLSACLISTPAMNTGFFIGKLTAIGSTRLILTAEILLDGSDGMLLQLDQRAEEVTGMDEGDALARHVVLRLAATQHAHAGRAESVHGLRDVIDAETEVMNAALRVAFEELGDRRIRTRWLDQLDLAGAELDISEAHALLGVHHARSDLEPVLVVELPRGRLDVGYDDGDVVQAGDHGLS